MLEHERNRNALLQTVKRGEGRGRIEEERVRREKGREERSWGGRGDVWPFVTHL